jgi:rRNA maturation endonuclease Nob1
MKRINNYDEQQALEWFTELQKTYKRLGLKQFSDKSFEKLENIRHSGRYCERCETEINKRGNVKFCHHCHNLLTEKSFNEERIKFYGKV